MEVHSSVTVLLSSYNGEKYIEDQILSILAQRLVRVRLVIRDDGSVDKTLMILKRLAAKHQAISVYFEDNIGYIKSFFYLLKNADIHSDFYAFSDQDDIWLPDKLCTAVSALRRSQMAVPVMYCSRTEYVNTSLKHLSYSPVYNPSKVGFGNALVQNIATGCTIVINGEARKLIANDLPEICIVHDWWIYLVVSAFGLVIYDKDPYIKYRQHAGNVIGASASSVKNIIKRTRRFFGSLRNNRTSSQIAEFNRIFGSQLTSDQKYFIKQILNSNRGISGRLSLIFKFFYWRQSLVDDILLRIVMLTGRF